MIGQKQKKPLLRNGFFVLVLCNSILKYLCENEYLDNDARKDVELDKSSDKTENDTKNRTDYRDPAADKSRDRKDSTSNNSNYYVNNDTDDKICDGIYPLKGQREKLLQRFHNKLLD